MTSILRRKSVSLVGAAIAFTAFLAGCPNDASQSGPVDTCASAGEQCRLEGGQLGVCTFGTGDELTCAPQH